MWLVAKDSATLEDRDLVRRQAGILARHLQLPADLPVDSPASDRQAAGSIVQHGDTIHYSPTTRCFALSGGFTTFSHLFDCQ